MFLCFNLSRTNKCEEYNKTTLLWNTISEIALCWRRFDHDSIRLKQYEKDISYFLVLPINNIRVRFKLKKNALLDCNDTIKEHLSRIHFSFGLDRSIG